MENDVERKFKLQEVQYKFPYHQLVDFEQFRGYEIMYSMPEYYGYLSHIMGTIEAEPYQSLLDVGCGDGKLIHELIRRGGTASYFGVDLSEPAIALAKGFNFGNGSKFEAIPVSDVSGQYDVVTFIETLEHIPDDLIEKIASDLKLRLKDDGRLIVAVPTTNFPTHKKHYRHYTLDLLKEHMPGFKLESHKFLVKQGKMYFFVLRLVAKLGTFGFIRRFCKWLFNKHVNEATPSTGRHLVAVFKKDD